MEAQEAATAAGTLLAPATDTAMTTINSDAYINKFHNPDVNSGDVMDGMEQLFTKLEVPIGLASKLIGLQDFDIDIVIDDSGSMRGIRWQEVQARLLEFMNFIQFVPTGKVTMSFLDRSDSIEIKRRGKNNQIGLTPAQFYQQAAQFITNQFRRGPDGGTPIWRNIKRMLRRAEGKTAHYLITDGLPTGNEFESPKEEIEAIKNLLLQRNNPQSNPFTFLCCSTNFTDTLWMHEIEEIACRPGAVGFIAALQNFAFEQLEVLNDQGTWFPYSRSVWLICNMVAALNPNDLDAFDQHSPLTKYILDNVILGRVSTDAEYLGYFIQHPNATWLFQEDYNLFLTVQMPMQIPSVSYFETTLADKLAYDIRMGNDVSEPTALQYTEDMLLGNFNRPRPRPIYDSRQDFWYNHYLTMEQQQFNFILQHQRPLTQNIWVDYMVMRRLAPMWQNYISGFHGALATAQQANLQAQQQQVVQQGQEGQEAPPPPYEHPAIGVVYNSPQPPASNNRYYNGYVTPMSNYSSSSSATLYKPQPQQYGVGVSQSIGSAYRPYAGGQQNPQQYNNSPGCCNLM